VALIALFIDALSMSPQKYHFNAQC